MGRKALIRMAWLCAELHQGNHFSKELYWQWHEEAAEALRRLDQSENVPLFEDEHQLDLADRKDLNAPVRAIPWSEAHPHSKKWPKRSK